MFWNNTLQKVPGNRQPCWFQKKALNQHQPTHVPQPVQLDRRMTSFQYTTSLFSLAPVLFNRQPFAVLLTLSLKKNMIDNQRKNPQPKQNRLVWSLLSHPALFLAGNYHAFKYFWRATISKKGVFFLDAFVRTGLCRQMPSGCQKTAITT